MRKTGSIIYGAVSHIVSLQLSMSYIALKWLRSFDKTTAILTEYNALCFSYLFSSGYACTSVYLSVCGRETNKVLCETVYACYI